jgi:hypothetical protein
VEQGYHVIETVHGAMEIWIVSDLNADELTQFARTPVLSLAGFLTLGALRLCAASSPSDTIYLESNSTAGNSIFTYTFNFTSAPVLKSTTPAGGIGVFDPTFALGPFDSDQNLIEKLQRYAAVRGEFGFQHDRGF